MTWDQAIERACAHYDCTPEQLADDVASAMDVFEDYGIIPKGIWDRDEREAEQWAEETVAQINGYIRRRKNAPTA